MKPIQIGIIGLGHRGRSLGRVLREAGAEKFTVVAVCDTQPKNVAQTVRELELPEAAGHTDYHNLLANPQVEAVLIETGAQLLAPISIEALESGKHVLCDVPMLFEREEAAALARAVEKSSLVYGMAEQVRFANFATQWKRRIEAGEIGEPLFVQGEYFHPVPGWYYEPVENDGQSPLRTADDPRRQASDPNFRKAWRNTFKHPIKYIPHELSPLLKIVDDRVTQVSCFAADARAYGDAVDMLDMECAMMRTAKGRVIRIVNSFTVPRHIEKEQAHHWYHIMGTDGYIESARPGWGTSADTPSWDMKRELIRRKDGQFEETHYGWDRPDNPWAAFSGGHGGLEAFVFEAFFQSIRHGAANEMNVYNAIESVLPGIIAAESVEAGGVLLEVPNLRK